MGDSFARLTLIAALLAICCSSQALADSKFRRTLSKCIPMLVSRPHVIETIEPKLPDEPTIFQYRKLLEDLKDIRGYSGPNYPLAQLHFLAKKYHTQQLNDDFGKQFISRCRAIIDGYELVLTADGGPVDCIKETEVKIEGRLTAVYRFCKYMSEFDYSGAIVRILEADELDNGNWSAMQIIRKFSERLLITDSADIKNRDKVFEKDFVCRMAKETIRWFSEHPSISEKRSDEYKAALGKESYCYRSAAGSLRRSCNKLSEQLSDIVWLLENRYLDETTLSVRADQLLATLNACEVLSGCSWEELGITC